MAKRAFDVLSSLLALIVLSPLLFAIGMIVRSESEGGAFFRQIRVGKNRKPFTLLKFRSMHVDAAGPLITVGEKDARITTSGQWLRRTKLDELPQLWNVLKGDMSVVGPRPEVPKYVELYDEEMLLALAVRPGLTDPASIDAFDEGEELASSNEPEAHYRNVILPRKVRAQVAYARRSNLFSDGRIIARTLLRILKR
ncbi:sugar transferase [Flavobacteriales bacterium]|nr:sugar transferase [Flavobacteriales bacterium]